jgi:phenylalanyl-tRNA synthetase beta chain
MTVKPLDHPSFIKGRCAEVVTKGDKVKGFFGEVSPLVISNFNLEYPVVGFELEFNN